MSGREHGAARPARTDAPAARLRRAVPSLRTAVAGAVLWGMLMATSALLAIAHWAAASHIAVVLLFFGVGAALAFPLALFLARLLADGRPSEQRFAAAFLMLGLVTAGLTALLFALDYRIYYASWHGEAFSAEWTLQLFFTTAGALYQFAVIGLRFYFPLGLVALLAAGLWFATRPR